MLNYIGTKRIKAEPMTLGAYNKHRGWDIPDDEDPASAGYIIHYLDGYISWSPLKQFDEAYRLTTGMTFGLAIEAMKKGLKVHRKGWNGKNMWLIMVPSTPNKVPFMEGTPYRDAGLVRPTQIDAHIDMYTAKGTMQPGWLASQNDMLAEDWGIILDA